MMSRQNIRLRAPQGWINDPNGFLYYKGLYHLFYQHFPYAPRWGTMHWGHAVSADLVHWEHRSIALFPTRTEDRNGCFSGSAVESDGRMHLFYTGVCYGIEDPADIHRCADPHFTATQLTISSADGFSFDCFGGKQVVVPPIGAGQAGDRTDTRDPKVWRGRACWWMVLGSKTADRHGQLLFYRSDDLVHWTAAGQTVGRDGWGAMWECPDYFETEGGGVLLLSPIGIRQVDRGPRNIAVCCTASFCESAGKADLTGDWQPFDWGMDLYAPQSTTDACGRRVVVAWLRMPTAPDGTWNGMFCVPRVVNVRQGQICFAPHPAILGAFTQKISADAGTDSECVLIRAQLPEGGTLTVGGYRIFRKDGRVYGDRTAVFPDERAELCCATPHTGDACDLCVIADRFLVEVFVNGGQYVLSHAVRLTDLSVHADMPFSLYVPGEEDVKHV